MDRKGIYWILVIIVLVCLLLDSQRRICTGVYTVEKENLPVSFDGFRIVQLSDLHGAEFGQGNKRLLETVAALEPDLIAVTGDLVDEQEDMNPMLALMGELSELALCCYVTGNHEWALADTAGLKTAIKARGVRVLDNRCLQLTRDGESITLCGVDDPNGPADMMLPEEVIDAARREHPEDFLLLLGHRNDWARKHAGLDADLILCGHGHGGLVRLPWVGGLFGTERNLFPRHTEGLVETETFTMLVSRGLGNSPGTLRLFNNPEIVVVNLKKI